MEYEQILFGLQPLLNAANPKDVPVQDVFLQSYITVLEQLAVHLRAESNRDLIRETGLLSQLLRVLNSFLDYAFQESSKRIQFLQISSELVRSIANCLVDNDANREVFWNGDCTKHNEFIDYYAGRILGLFDEEDYVVKLQLRTVVLISNLAMDNDTYYERAARRVAVPLFKLIISMKNVFLDEQYNLLVGTSFDLLCSFVDHKKFLSLVQLVSLSEVLIQVCKCIESTSNIAVCNSGEIDTSKNDAQIEEVEDEEEDTFLPSLLNNISHCILKTSEPEDYNFSDEVNTSILQHNLLTSLENLGSKEFDNQLIINREILSSIANVSSNKSYSNGKDVDISIKLLQCHKSSYAAASALIVISNYVSDAQKANEINKKLSYDIIVKSSTTIRDPIQFQGLLSLLRKLLKPDIIMFTPNETLAQLSQLLVICHDQSNYYQGLSPILEMLLQKLLAVSTAKTLTTMIAAVPRFTEVLSNRGIILSCQAIDKLAKKRDLESPLSVDLLAKKVFEYCKNITLDNLLQDPFTTFHILRSTGIYINETPTDEQDEVFDKYSDVIFKLLEASLSTKSSTETAAKAIWNNGRYLAGMVIASKCSTIPKEVKDIAHQCFQ